VNLQGDRIFFSCNVGHENSILLSFGRSNPSKIFQNIIRIKGLSEESMKENELSCQTITPQIEQNVNTIARFRHASCITSDFQLFIYGGKYFDENSATGSILNDAYLFNDLNGDFMKIEVKYKFCFIVKNFGSNFGLTQTKLPNSVSFDPKTNRMAQHLF
jgi:hypothetical protein